uniref:Uncharacterized protein n=1 Tax=Klebsiella pneumoniae TaxID=573 RepID=D4HQT7_KLEPN|nr:hypothetical protein pKF140-051 [Klebsiella pneumoniae]AJS10198.1 hypothetical protein [Klebsiella pneumoniae]
MCKTSGERVFCYFCCFFTDASYYFLPLPDVANLN